jgi:hypothetical protein
VGGEGAIIHTHCPQRRTRTKHYAIYCTQTKELRAARLGYSARITSGLPIAGQESFLCKVRPVQTTGTLLPFWPYLTRSDISRWVAMIKYQTKLCENQRGHCETTRTWYRHRNEVAQSTGRIPKGLDRRPWYHELASFLSKCTPHCLLQNPLLSKCTPHCLLQNLRSPFIHGLYKTCQKSGVLSPVCFVISLCIFSFLISKLQRANFCFSLFRFFLGWQWVVLLVVC